MSFQVISDTLIPSIAGLFFFVYFLYFVMINQPRTASFVHFIIFLVSFSLFLVGRPLQLLLGQYPVQLIIVNIRMTVLFAFSITSITVASNLFTDRKHKPRNGLIYGIGLAAAVIYVVFNTLGTIGSKPIFQWGGLMGYDNLTPDRMPPFYGREVTITTQVAIGILLLINSTINLHASESGESLSKRMENKVFLFNSGVFLFAFTFIIGSLTKQWWLYYFFSIFSTLLFGAGVILDIRELYNNYEKLIPVIKEDIIQNVALSKYSNKKLKELLRCLGKSEKLDTFAVIEVEGLSGTSGFPDGTMKQMSRVESAVKVITKDLDRDAGWNNYLIIPFDDTKIGIVLNVGQSDREIYPIELMEKIQADVRSACSVTTWIGIGRSYPSLDDLRTSYYDALNALEYAQKLEGCFLIHINNIRQDDSIVPRYPAKEKVQLLSALQMGDRESCLAQMEIFLPGFRKFIEFRPESLKLRLLELAGSFIDSAILAGGDEEQLNKLVSECFRDVEFMASMDQAETWLRDLLERILGFVTVIYKSRAAIIVEKASEIMNQRLSEPITNRDVAKELFISSSYFQALFKQEMGSTFVEHLTRLRVEKAKELLLNTTLSITEIAFETGFKNPNYFSSIFRKLEDMPPKDFRGRNTRHRIR
ncbi:MAG: helix-turn-helix domain-containing protein [Spirochaetales bacterium]|nr:helix-turn-helix domain-containing protein [Spirochaetales bacterium]